MLTFADAINRSKNAAVAGVFKKAIEYNPFLTALPLRNANNVLTQRRMREDQKPAMEPRGYNEEYPTEQKATFKPLEVQLKPHGAKFNIDRKLLKVRTPEGQTQLAEQMASFGESLGLDLPWFLFNGNEANNVKQFNGIKAWLSTTYVNRVIVYDEGAGNTNGIQIAALDKFVLNMNQLLANHPGYLFTTREILNKIDSLATIGNNSVIASRFKWDWIDLPDGERYRMAMWDNVPMLYPGENSQQVAILAQDETFGNSNITGSIYGVKFGPNGVDILQDGEPEIVQRKTAIGIETIFDWALTVDVVRDKAVSALVGILA